MKTVYFSLFFLSITLFYTLRLYRLEGTSMNYALLEGDYVLTYRLFNTIERGDLLVIRHPKDPYGRLYIKRCVALPGDRFFQKDRAFYLQIESDSNLTREMSRQYDLYAVKTPDGYFLKEPYVKYYGVVHNRRLQLPKVLTTLPLTTIADKHYFMLGDYRDNSADSRFFGAVPREWICSKVIYILKRAQSWKKLLVIKEVD